MSTEPGQRGFIVSIADAMRFLINRNRPKPVTVDQMGRTPIPLAPAKPIAPVATPVPTPAPQHQLELPVIVAVTAAEHLQPKEEPKPRSTGKKTLVGLVGVTCAGLLMHYVPAFESGRTVDVKVVAGSIVAINRSGNRHLKAYRDQVGVLTICDGDTKNVRVGEIDTPEQCDVRLEQQLIAHAEPVMKCAPELKDRPYQLAASISLAYNIGPAGFCRSSVVMLFHQKKWDEGCNRFLVFNKAGGRFNRGLDYRRHKELEICQEKVKIL